MVPEMAFVAAGLGREADLLAIVGRSRITAWVEASAAFLRGEYVEAAQAFNRIGSRPHEAYVRLHGSLEDIKRAIEFYRSVHATHFLTIGEERLRGA